MALHQRHHNLPSTFNVDLDLCVTMLNRNTRPAQTRTRFKEEGIVIFAGVEVETLFCFREPLLEITSRMPKGCHGYDDTSGKIPTGRRAWE